MEKKNSKGIIVLSIILLAIVVFLLGYIVGNNLVKEKNSNNNENDSSNNVIKNEFYDNFLRNKTEMKQIQTFYKFNIFGIIDKSGNVYIKIKDGLTLSDESTKDFGVYGKYELDGYYDSEGPNGSNVIEGYKLHIKNVIAAYVTEAGNGGSRYIILLKSDGTIGVLLTIPPSENILFLEYTEKFEGVKNIVTVITDTTDGNTLSPFLVDIDGNIYPFWKVFNR